MRINVNYRHAPDGTLMHVEFCQIDADGPKVVDCTHLGLGKLSKLEWLQYLNQDLSRLVGTGLDQPHAHPDLPNNWSMWDVIAAHVNNASPEMAGTTNRFVWHRAIDSEYSEQFDVLTRLVNEQNGVK